MSAERKPPRAAKLRNVRIDRLECGRFQPRRVIDGVALKRLAESILSQGVVQPLFVRKSGGKLEIVAGQRRWYAAKIAGLKTVPTVIGTVSDETALAIALIENLHREDLNPIDEAVAIERLVDQFGMTHQQVADTIGKSRAAVTNLLRLLELPKEVQDMVADGVLDNGHARALLALPREKCKGVAEEAARKHLSVRTLERLARDPPSEPERDGPPAPTSSLGEELRTLLKDSADIRPRRKGRWRLDVEFGDVDELLATLATIESLLRALGDGDARRL
jgi:ParB family chromosome partitioning protein